MLTTCDIPKMQNLEVYCPAYITHLIHKLGTMHEDKVYMYMKLI
jgi:hypothetical protein